MGELAHDFAIARDTARKGGEHRHEGPGFVDGVPSFDVPELRRYHSDPAFAAQHDAETQSWRDRTNAMLDASIARVRAERAGR